MKFTQTHSTGSDCTAPYDVTEYKAKTVAEFVNEVVSQRTNEWGDFEVKGGDGRPCYHYKRVKYKHGELLDEIPEAWKNTEIAEGCTLHIDTDPNSGDEFPVTFTVHKGEQYLIKDANENRTDRR